MWTSGYDTNMLPADVRDIIMSFHEPWPFHHTRMVQEFKELVAGRPWTAFSMLWVDWWDVSQYLCSHDLGGWVTQ